MQQDQMYQITPIQIDSHRNGVGGEGFYAVLFDWDDDATHGLIRRMLGVVFEEAGYVSVFDVAGLSDPEVGILFGRGNSWRGDNFESALRAAIAEWEANGRNPE